MFSRLGAYGALLGGVTLAVGHIWSYTSDEAVMGAGLLIAAAHLAIFLVLVALYARLEGAPTTEAGTVLALVGNGVIMGITFTYLGEAEGIATAAAYEEGTVGLVAMAGVIAFTLGLALLGLAVLHTGRLPSALGIVYVASALLSFVGGFTPEIVFVVGVVLGAIGLVWTGRELQESVEADVRAPAHA